MATMKRGVKKFFRKFFKRICCCCCRSSSDDEDNSAGTSLGSPLPSLVGSRRSSSESVFQSCNSNLTSTSEEASIDEHKENDLTKANVLIGDAGKDGEEISSDESNADHLTKANVLLGGAWKVGEDSSSDESNLDDMTQEEKKATSVQWTEGDTVSSIVVKDEASTSTPVVSAANDKGLRIQYSTVPSAVFCVSKAGLNKPNARDEDSIPSSEFITSATDTSVLKWQEDLREGAGLKNLGNTCFVNASLQGLTYTAPLANFLLYGDHSWTCKQTEFCMMCLLEKHVFNTFMNRGTAINPIEIVRNFKYIGEDLCFGRQEDAHVFLGYVIYALHQSCLFNQRQLGINMETPTLIHQIFRGYLKSRVECMQCFSISDTLDSFLDISLNINKSLDLVKAFHEFTKTETLAEYRCGMCSRVGKSTKRVSLHVVPNVLIITIKRYDEFGDKIDKDFLFPEELDIRPFMFNQVVHEPELYSLYSVIVHHGTTTNSGHYYSYNKVSNGSWFRMDDTDVMPVTNAAVLEDQAYILFYTKSPEQNAIPVDIEDPQSSNWVASGTQGELTSAQTTQGRTLKEERTQPADTLPADTPPPKKTRWRLRKLA